MPVLPHHQRIALQAAYTVEIRLAAAVIAQHPADMREPETTTRAVRVALEIVNIAVVDAVASTPVQCAVLQRHRAKEQVRELEHRVRFIGTMREQTMVSAGDRHAVGAEKQDGPDPGSGVDTRVQMRTTVRP